MVRLVDPKVLRQEVAADLERSDPGRIRLQCESNQLVKQGKILDQVRVGRFVKRRIRFRLVRPATAGFETLFHIAD